MRRSQIRKYTEYFLLYFLIAITAVPYFYSDIEFFILGFFISSFIFIRRKKKFDKHFLIIFGCFLLIELLQAVYFSNFELTTTIGTFIRLGFAYTCAKVLGNKFYDYFFNIIYFFSIVSLFFYIPSLISNSFADFFVNSFADFFVSPFYTKSDFYVLSPNIIIYTFEKSLFVSSRNSGPFWEPGAFAVFLILAIIFRLIKMQKITDKKNLLLALVLLTTTSTTGYIALFLVVVFFIVFNKKVKASKYAFVIIILYGASLAYAQIEFLGKKAEEDIQLASETTSSRFGSALVDLKDFSQNPIVGYGRGTNRYAGKGFVFFSAEQHRNNGLTQLLVTYGIIISVLYFVYYYKNIKRYCRVCVFNEKFALGAFFIILILGFSQPIFVRPFFYALLFVNIKPIKLKKTNAVSL